MAVQNDFLVFAGQSGANVVPQSSYAGQTWQQTGFIAGIAPSAQLNKPWRQSSIMAAVMAQFIVQNTGQPAVDDGTTSTLLGNLTAATAGRYLGTQTFLASGPYVPGTYNGLTATKAHMRGVAAGGGSGGCIATASSQVAVSAGGSAGNPFDFWVVSGLAAMSVSIGAAGAAGALGAGGGTGGDIVIGVIATVKGGSGGSAGNATSTFPSLSNPAISTPTSTIASAGGMVLAGIINGNGQTAVRGIALNSGVVLYSAGGNSSFGSGGTVDQAAATGYGSGAGGNTAPISSPALTGFAGAPGILIIDEYA